MDEYTAAINQLADVYAERKVFGKVAATTPDWLVALGERLRPMWEQAPESVRSGLTGAAVGGGLGLMGGALSGATSEHGSPWRSGLLGLLGGAAVGGGAGLAAPSLNKWLGSETSRANRGVPAEVWDEASAALTPPLGARSLDLALNTAGTVAGTAPVTTGVAAIDAANLARRGLMYGRPAPQKMRDYALFRSLLGDSGGGGPDAGQADTGLLNRLREQAATGGDLEAKFQAAQGGQPAGPRWWQRFTRSRAKPDTSTFFPAEPKVNPGMPVPGTPEHNAFLSAYQKWEKRNPPKGGVPSTAPPHDPPPQLEKRPGSPAKPEITNRNLRDFITQKVTERASKVPDAGKLYRNRFTGAEHFGTIEKPWQGRRLGNRAVAYGLGLGVDALRHLTRSQQDADRRQAIVENLVRQLQQQQQQP